MLCAPAELGSDSTNAFCSPLGLGCHYSSEHRKLEITLRLHLHCKS